MQRKTVFVKTNNSRKKIRIIKKKKSTGDKNVSYNNPCINALGEAYTPTYPRIGVWLQTITWRDIVRNLIRNMTNMRFGCNFCVCVKPYNYSVKSKRSRVPSVKRLREKRKGKTKKSFRRDEYFLTTRNTNGAHSCLLRSGHMVYTCTPL